MIIISLLSSTCQSRHPGQLGIQASHTASPLHALIVVNLVHASSKVCQLANEKHVLPDFPVNEVILLTPNAIRSRMTSLNSV